MIQDTLDSLKEGFSLVDLETIESIILSYINSLSSVQEVLSLDLG